MLTLAECIFAVADHPNQETHDTFCKTFLQSRVGAQIPKEAGAQQPGNRITTESDKFGFPTGHLPNGDLMLVVIANVSEIANRDSGNSYFELDANDVIKMAIGQNAGIIVQASSGERKAWAGISKQDVIQLSQG